MHRSETAADRAAIFEVHRAAFPSDAEARLVDLLRAAGRATVSLVLEVDGAVAGHVLFSPVTAAEGGEGLGLGPVAIKPELQRRGLGGRLIEAGLALARASRYPYCVVLGEPEYYHRFGFRHARPLGLDNEYGADEPFMAMELRPGGLAGVRGLVKYAPEFAAVS
jgi:putative acetyltransferase